MAEEPMIPTAQCAECRRFFPQSELMEIEHVQVCAECKPLLVKRILEGQAVRGFITYGGFWLRFAAVIIDNLILLVPGCVINVVFWLPMILLKASDSMSDKPGVLVAVQVVCTLLQWLIGITLNMLYEVLFLWKKGATPGKMACGLRVINADGSEQLPLGKCFGRFFAKILSSIVCFIGYLIAAFDDEKRALHDHICNTRVVRVQ